MNKVIEKQRKMVKTELVASKIAKWEVRFLNHKYDRGDATNKGMTMSTFKQCRKANILPEPSVEDFKNISNTKWLNVLKNTLLG